MYSSDWNELGENKPQLEKKLSREQKKILDAVARIDKMNKYQTQRLEQKNKMRQKETVNVPQPVKQQKIQICQSTDPYAEKQIRIVPLLKDLSRNSEDQTSQTRKVVNSGYKLTNQDDLFMHLIEYRQAEREKHLQKKSKSLLGMPYNLSKDEIAMSSQQFLQSTRTAISRIQSKFQENKSKLRKPNAKEHKDFQSKFLTEDFLRN